MIENRQFLTPEESADVDAALLTSPTASGTGDRSGSAEMVNKLLKNQLPLTIYASF